MAVHSVTVTNPGAETGDATGWTFTVGSGPQIRATGTGGVASHTGSFYFGGSANQNLAQWGQTIAVPGALEASVDAGGTVARLQAYHRGDTDTDSGNLIMEFFASDGTTLLATVENELSDPADWTLEELYRVIPATTRYIRIGTFNDRVSGTQNSVYWDDFVLDISDDPAADGFSTVSTDAQQLGVYVWGTFDSEAVRANQAGNYLYVASEGSSGLFETYSHQIGVYAWVRGMTDRRDLRAWPFTQDDHDFYVLQLGDNGTLVFDKLTNQWAQWRSPDKTFWRGNDGVQWEGWNICCDTDTGILWRIDPEGRLDDATTPITSVITGGTNQRMRKNAQCFMAELTVSEGQPPTGFDDGSVGITLRTSDDGGQTFTDHGEVVGEGVGEDITIRWYGLGVMPSPGRVFELTDTGYARRIDSLTMEVGDDTGG